MVFYFFATVFTLVRAPLRDSIESYCALLLALTGSKRNCRRGPPRHARPRDVYTESHHPGAPGERPIGGDTAADACPAECEFLTCFKIAVHFPKRRKFATASHFFATASHFFATVFTLVRAPLRDSIESYCALLLALTGSKRNNGCRRGPPSGRNMHA